MMSVAVDVGSFQRYEALRDANKVRRARRDLRVEAAFVARLEGLAAGRAVIADAIVECPDWLSGADAVTVLGWAPRVGDSVADRLYALSGARQRHLLRELTVRQLGVLGSGLRALGETTR